MDTKKRYYIGGEWFTQDELVLYQQEELDVLVEEVSDGEMTLKELLGKLLKGKTLARALAIVLIPETVPWPHGDISEFIRRNLKMSQQAEVVKDFFDCNAVALNAWAAAAKLVGKKSPHGLKSPTISE